MKRVILIGFVFICLCLTRVQCLVAFEIYQDDQCTQIAYPYSWGPGNSLSAPLMVPFTNQCNFCGSTLAGITYTKVDQTGVRWCAHNLRSPNEPSAGSPCDTPQGSCSEAPLNTCTRACGPFGVVNGKWINVPDDGITFIALGANDEERKNKAQCAHPPLVSWYARYYYQEKPLCNTTLDCQGPREYVRDNGQVWYCESFGTTTCNTMTGMCENLHDCHIATTQMNRCGNVVRSNGIGVPRGVTDGTGGFVSYYVTQPTSNDGAMIPLPQHQGNNTSSASRLHIGVLALTMLFFLSLNVHK